MDRQRTIEDLARLVGEPPEYIAELASSSLVRGLRQNGVVTVSLRDGQTGASADGECKKKTDRAHSGKSSQSATCPTRGPSRGNRQGHALNQCGAASRSSYAMNFYWRYQAMSGLIAVRSTREATPIQMAASKASSMYIASVPPTVVAGRDRLAPVPTGRARQRHVGRRLLPERSAFGAHSILEADRRIRVSRLAAYDNPTPIWAVPVRSRLFDCATAQTNEAIG